MEIKNPYNSDGIVEDWETAAKLWEYTITSRLTGARQTPPSKNGLNNHKTDENGDTDMDEGMEEAGEQEKILQEFPLLMSEPAWNPAKERQKTIEIAMESWGVLLSSWPRLVNWQRMLCCILLCGGLWLTRELQVFTKQGDSSRG